MVTPRRSIASIFSTPRRSAGPAAAHPPDCGRRPGARTSCLPRLPARATAHAGGLLRLRAGHRAVLCRTDRGRGRILAAWRRPRGTVTEVARGFEGPLNGIAVTGSSACPTADPPPVEAPMVEFPAHPSPIKPDVSPGGGSAIRGDLRAGLRRRRTADRGPPRSRARGYCGGSSRWTPADGRAHCGQSSSALDRTFSRLPGPQPMSV